jgi:hypothetical protein
MVECHLHKEKKLVHEELTISEYIYIYIYIYIQNHFGVITFEINGNLTRRREN